MLAFDTSEPAPAVALAAPPLTAPPALDIVAPALNIASIQNFQD